MSKRGFFSELVLSLLIAAILLLIDYKISLGVLLGFTFSFLNYRLIEYRYNHLEHYNSWVILGALFSTSLLAVPLVISFLLPNIFNYIGVVVGLLVIKVKLIIEAVIKK